MDAINLKNYFFYFASFVIIIAGVKMASEVVVILFLAIFISPCFSISYYMPVRLIVDRIIRLIFCARNQIIDFTICSDNLIVVIIYQIGSNVNHKFIILLYSFSNLKVI